VGIVWDFAAGDILVKIPTGWKEEGFVKKHVTPSVARWLCTAA
jgi:hypothetical protein